MEKSHVSMTSYDCPLCQKEHSYRAEILLDMRLEKSMNPKIKAGLRICEECTKEDYTPVIECIEQTKESLNLGRLIHIRTEALNIDDINKESLENCGFLLCDSSTMDEFIGTATEETI